MHVPCSPTVRRLSVRHNAWISWQQTAGNRGTHFLRTNITWQRINSSLLLFISHHIPAFPPIQSLSGVYSVVTWFALHYPASNMHTKFICSSARAYNQQQVVLPQTTARLDDRTTYHQHRSCSVVAVASRFHHSRTNSTGNLSFCYDCIYSWF